MVTNKSHGKLNNAGVTLLELIIVIAIISVLTGAIIMGSSFLFGGREKKAYNDFQSAYSEARLNTMSKKNSCDLKLTYSDNTYYVQIGNGDKEKLITSPFTIQYRTRTDGGTESDLKKLTSEITISFNRSTGGLKPLKEGNTTSEEYLSELYIGERVLYFTHDSGKYSSEKRGIS